jgi:hypothetical protein
MRQRTIMWTLLLAMFLTLPTMLFLVQAVMFIPAIFYVAGILYMIPKALTSGSLGEMLTFLLFFGVHLGVYFVIYYVIGAILAKLISLFPNAFARHASVVALCAAMVAVMFFPVYGGGGHGPIQWETFGRVVQELERDYGRGATLIIYGGTLVVIGAIVGFKWWRRGESAAP